MQLNKPILVFLNMMDIVKKRGINLDTKVLEENLGVKILPISAKNKIGLANISEVINKSKEIIPNYNINFKSENEAYRYIDNVIKKASEEKGKSR